MALRHKYGAKAVNDNGIKFSSQLEHRFYRQLLLRQKTGEVLFFLMQVPFKLPGNKTYRLDFMIFLASGDVECVETKGFPTAVSNLKLAMVEDLYPIKINIVRKV